jgi:anti-sigma-K factor RskA
MSLSPEDDFSAAEYALGTLDPGERAAIAARRQREPELDEAIRAWEERLSPLAEAVPPIEPPRDYLAEIEARIHAPAPAPVPAAPNETVAALRSRLGRWRAAAIGATGLAAMLAIGVVFREATRETAPHEFVAVLQKSADSPAFAVTVNLDTRELTVRPVSAPAPTGKSYELWIIDAKLGAPRSLGVIDPANTTRADKLAGVDPAVVKDATYAVTVEPPGGSPNGKPSGAPVFVGKLIPVGP